MVPCPAIATFYQASGPRLTHPWLARFVTGAKPLPMVFVASSEEEAHRAASQWWADEQVKIASKEARIVAAREGRKQARAAIRQIDRVLP